MFGSVRAVRQLVSRHAPHRSHATQYDVAVVGGGIVGLATAREAAVRGASVVLLERETAVASGASSGNSGLGCTGYDAPAGSLERQLLRRSIQLRPAIHRSLGLSEQHHLRKAGSLVGASALTSHCVYSGVFEALRAIVFRMSGMPV